MRESERRTPSQLVGLVDSGFRFEEAVGSGTMGTVYRATQVRSGLSFAVKVLHAHLAELPEVVLRFRKEGGTASRIDSDHVVRTLGHGTLSAGQPFLADPLNASTHARWAQLRADAPHG